MSQTKNTIKELSVLIPTYNDYCAKLTERLSLLLSQQTGLAWEVIVADDGSTNQNVLESNRSISNIHGCRILERGFNSGRAAIRNYLAGQARYEYLLFIDGDMTIGADQFIRGYLQQTGPVVYGGYKLRGDGNSLRLRYEKACEESHTVERRRQNPNSDFHTSNFLIRRDIFLEHPLDERFRSYGYEDVFYGKQLKEAGITIEHIDNPAIFDIFETDEEYMNKTDEALATLLCFDKELRGYSRLLGIRDKMNRWHVSAILRIIAKPLLPVIRKRLCKGGAPLWLFQIYKLLRII